MGWDAGDSQSMNTSSIAMDLLFPTTQTPFVGPFLKKKTPDLRLELQSSSRLIYTFMTPLRDFAYLATRRVLYTDFRGASPIGSPPFKWNSTHKTGPWNSRGTWLTHKIHVF